MSRHEHSTHGHGGHDHDGQAHDDRAREGHAGHAHGPVRHDRAFAIGIAVNIAFVAVEAAAGWRIDSLALLADAGHNLGDVLEWVIDRVDLVLVMSVNPGFGGQSFIPSALRKVAQVRQLIDASGRDIRLEVDGGIKVDNIRQVADAGADTFVAGSAIFGKPDYKAVIDAMRAALAQ